MAARQLTKIDNHFLVKYVCDDKFQVRSRGKFRSEDMVSIGQCYQVQWGNKRQIEEAKVIATGSETEMKSQMEEATSETLTKSPPKKKAKKSRVPVPKLPRPVVTKAPIAKKTPKPLAKMIATASPPELVAAEAAAAAEATAEQTDTSVPALSPLRLEYRNLSPPPHLTAEELKDADEEPVMLPAVDEQTEETVAAPTFETSARDVFRGARPSPLTQKPGAQQAQLNSIDSVLRILVKEQIKSRKAAEATAKKMGEIVSELKHVREGLDKLNAAASGVQRRPLVELAALSDLASDTIPELTE